MKAGDRVLLRSPTAADAEVFTSLNCRDRRHYAGWVAPPVTPAQFTAYLERCARSEFEGLAA